MMLKKIFSALLLSTTLFAATAAHAQSNPAADVRAHKSWEYGPFVNYGRGIGDRSDYNFFWTGVQVGKQITPVLKAGPLSGQFELAGELIPFFQAYTPAAHTLTVTGTDGSTTYKIGGGTFTGFSVAPVIFRWNFATPSRRFQPWFQAKGGVLYTTHKFPPDVEVAPGTAGGTSVWNFTPQGGVGFHYFTAPKRSIDFGLNAVHISSSSLGDKNPGVNASIQFQLGYSFWK